MKQLLCGAADCVITPKLGLGIPGYFGVRKATGVKTDLYTHAVVLENGEQTLVLISIDIIDFQASLATKIRKLLHDAIGVEPSAVMVVATHTHTAQPTNYTGFAVKKNTPAIERLIKLTVETAIKAYESRRPVRVGFGNGEETRISFTRNYRMNDGSIVTNPLRSRNDEIVSPLRKPDCSVGVLRFDDEQGKTVAQIINFACHPDTVGGTEYCADYPGVLREKLKEHFGKDSVVLFLNGCAGDINHIDALLFKNNPNLQYNREFYLDHYIKMGEMLAETVLKIHKAIEMTDRSELSALSQTFRAKRRQPSAEQVAWSEEILKQAEPNTRDLIYAKELLELHRHPRLYANVEIQAMQIAGCSIVGLPCEAYNEMGVAVKAQSPFGQNMVASLANGTVGYLVTEPAFSAGVYESKLARYNSFLSPCDADQMVTVAGKLLKKINCQ